jgi:hypothetical protein
MKDGIGMIDQPQERMRFVDQKEEKKGSYV